MVYASQPQRFGLVGEHGQPPDGLADGGDLVQDLWGDGVGWLVFHVASQRVWYGSIRIVICRNTFRFVTATVIALSQLCASILAMLQFPLFFHLGAEFLKRCLRQLRRCRLAVLPAVDRGEAHAEGQFFLGECQLPPDFLDRFRKVFGLADHGFGCLRLIGPSATNPYGTNCKHLAGL